MSEAKLVGGRYEVGELLGFGGMAEVHKGRDIRLDRDVAIKILRSDLARDPSFQSRFRREAQAAAGLNHPSIVAVYDSGEDIVEGTDQITPYIVMEFVEGRTLRDVLKAEGRLPAKRAMEIAAEISAALDFSHRSGIVHRDVKPGNVMITTNGAVKVMDFGIARALADGAATVTAASAVIGTAQYLSPEQARGESVDARSDVYSTGCLLYELLAGHPPFVGDSPVAVAYQHVREIPQIPSSVNPLVPRELDSIVMKALAKNPLNRYQTAAEMRTDLNRAIAGQPVEAEAVLTDAERTQMISAPLATGGAHRDSLVTRYDDEPARSRRGVLAWTAIVLALLAVIGLAGWYLVKNDNKQNTPRTGVVSKLVGLDPNAAIDQIKRDGFTVGDRSDSHGPCRSGDENSPVVTVNKGTVCTQSVPEGSDYQLGQKISFTVYAGPQDVTVPSVKGLTFQQANDLLNQNKLKPVQKLVDDGNPAGFVIDQSPPAFTSVAPGSSVTLTVSNGHSKIPSVVHLTEAAARAKLQAAGFFNIASVDGEQTKGFKVGDVMAVNPPEGTSYDRASTVTITVAVAPVLPPCPTPTPSGSSSPPASSSATGPIPPISGLPTGSSSPSTSPSASASPTGSPTCIP